ncbi:MAG: alkaline phosphatase family protein, partial [Streptosporangiaceae bacterium]
MRRRGIGAGFGALRAAAAVVAVAALAAACSVNGAASSGVAAEAKNGPDGSVERVAGGPTGSYLVPPGIHKIKHVIVIMQENRSFDSYFGTFPGANGYPTQNGVITTCEP